MKQKLLKSLLLLCILVGGVCNAWATDVTGTINFGSATGSTKINDASVSGDDSQDNSWTVTTVGTSSFTQQSGYSQVGSSSKPATSITFTTTLPSSQTIKAFSAKFGGFSSTAGTVTLKVGDTTVGTGSLNANNDVTVSATNTTTAGTVLTVTVTSIAKGVKCYYISYTYEDDTPSSSATFTNKAPSIEYPAAKTYSQVPTTATGYNGNITYSITANTAGATINASTGLVTVTGGGSVTVKATAAASSGFAGSEDTYTLTVNDTRSEADLSWSAASANVTYGADNNVFPSLTNTHGVTVTYASTNTKAATINETTGEITLLDFAGSTYIKAIFAGNDDYLPKTVDYTLNVTKAPFAVKDGVFDFVEAAALDEDYGSGVTTTNDGNTYVTVDKTWTAGNVTMVTSGKYRWWSSNSGCDLRFYNNNPYSSATFSVPAGYTITKIVTTGGNFVSANTGTLNGANWTGASQSVKLSISTSTVNIKTITVTYVTTVPVTLNASGYATFAANVPLDFSDDSEFSAWQITGVSGTAITFSQITGTVAANTGVLLKGTASATVNIPVAASGATLATNKLVGITTATDVAADTYYGLSDNKFVKVNAGTVPAGKALLPASVAAGVKEFTFIFEGENETAINSLTPALSKGEGVIYNLAGQRLQKMQKGVNIVNGKKVLF